MKRPGAVDKTLQRIRRWREICPQITIPRPSSSVSPARPRPNSRSCSISRPAQLDRVGAFAYSPVEGAQAMPCGSLAERSSRSGWRVSCSARPRSAPQARSQSGACSRAGRCHRRRTRAPARSMADAPEIDGWSNPDGREAGWCRAISRPSGSWAAKSTIFTAKSLSPGTMGRKDEACGSVPWGYSFVIGRCLPPRRWRSACPFRC